MPKIKIDTNICKGCSLCVNACPKKIIIISKDKMNEKGYNTAEFIGESKCTGCAFCAMMCPDVAITVER